MAPFVLRGVTFDPADPGDRKLISTDKTSFLLVQVDYPLTSPQDDELKELVAYKCFMHRKDAYGTYLVYLPAKEKLERLKDCSFVKHVIAYDPCFKVNKHLREELEKESEAPKTTFYISVHNTWDHVGARVDAITQAVRKSRVRERLAAFFDVEVMTEDDEIHGCSGLTLIQVNRCDLKEMVEIITSWEEVHSVGRLGKYYFCVQGWQSSHIVDTA